MKRLSCNRKYARYLNNTAGDTTVFIILPQGESPSDDPQSASTLPESVQSDYLSMLLIPKMIHTDKSVDQLENKHHGQII